jgi:hypothetical protein
VCEGLNEACSGGCQVCYSDLCNDKIGDKSGETGDSYEMKAAEDDGSRPGGKGDLCLQYTNNLNARHILFGSIVQRT